MMDAKKLAAALRSSAREATDWRDGLRLVAIRLEAPAPAPALRWHGPFEHHGGECPVPPETVVAVHLRDGTEDVNTAGVLRWRHCEEGDDITSFSYAADNPEGWVPRPEDWVPPESAFPIETRCQDGFFPGRTMDRLMTYAWSNVTHIRLLPRNSASGCWSTPSNPDRSTTVGSKRERTLSKVPPLQFSIREVAEPAPADVRELVRGALNAALAWEDSRAAYLAEKALAALDAAPAEGETVGYSAINRAGMITGTWQPHQKTLAQRWLRDAERGSRIVRLVAEPGHD